MTAKSVRAVAEDSAAELADVLGSLLSYAANESRRLRLLAGAASSDSERSMIETQALHLEAMCQRGTMALARARAGTH